MISGYPARNARISETAEFVKCSHDAVLKLYHDLMNGTVSTTQLRRLLRPHRHSTVDQLAAQMYSGATKRVFNTTLHRTLLRMGLRSRHLATAPRLTGDHLKHLWYF